MTKILGYAIGLLVMNALSPNEIEYKIYNAILLGFVMVLYHIDNQK